MNQLRNSVRTSLARGRLAGRTGRGLGVISAALLMSAVSLRPVSAQVHDPENGMTRGEAVADSLEAPPPAVDPRYLGRDTVYAAPGKTYDAGPIHRFLFGDLNRDLWEIEFAVPVLDLDGVGGGLEVDELSGGKQTLGMRFKSRDGRVFQFRSMVKNAGRAIPDILQSTPVEDVVQDQMGALLPLAAMVVAELLDAADVLVAKPRPVVMPDDPRLGVYREAFAGRMGWIEERPNEREGDRPGFAGSSKITGSDELLEELRENPRSYVNARELLKARLIDMLVNDWDRHLDQWRWASFDEGDRIRWDPIPRDRDWALTRIDGVLPRLARLAAPKYEGFSERPPDPYRMSWSAQPVDRRMLTSLVRSDFLEVAEDLQARLDDEAIERAVGVLPPEYLAEVGERLTRGLKNRRDHLVPVAEEFYELLARWVDLYGTDRADRVVLAVSGPGELMVQIRAPEDDLVTYERTFFEEETEEVRIYLRDGDDHVWVEGGAELPFDIRVVGGEGDDRYEDAGSSDRLHIYDADGDNAYELGPEAYVTESPHKGQEEPPVPYLRWDTRDWGHEWMPRAELRYDPDLGVYAGLGLSRYGFGFGYKPYRSRVSMSLLSGFESDQWIGDVEFQRPFGDRGWRAAANLDWYTERPTWLFGLGNETRVTGDTDLFRSSRNQVAVRLSARFVPDSTLEIGFGPSATFAGPIEDPAMALTGEDAYGTGAFQQLGLRGRVRFDNRDSYSLPTKGFYLRLDAKAFPPLLDVVEPFAGARAEARTYLGADLPGEPALHLRLLGEKVWGRTPFAELPGLGGSSTLPGYTERRFVGESAVSGTALLRLKVLPIHLFTDIDVGVHGLATVGRVWLSGESSDRWHPGYGGGIWLHLLSMDRTLSATLVNARDGGRAFYLGLGLPF